MGAVTSSADRRRSLVVDEVELNGVPTESVPRGATSDSVENGATVLGMAANIARPNAPRALLGEIERVFCHRARPDPWQRQLYAEWTSRLGHERMRGFLLNLRDQLAMLGDFADEGEREDLHRVAHDVASTAGMLGFLEVTRCCRAVLEGDAAGDQDARAALQAAVDDAIDCLDHHFAVERRDAA